MSCKTPLLTTPTSSGISRLLHSHQLVIEEKIRESLPFLSAKTKLRDACEYALVNGGKRFRPALVLMIAKALGNVADASQAALAIEFFHTASLVADDLPCMDDDDERRNKPSVHKVYGEAIALLVSYALIAAGYECLAKNADAIKKAKHTFSDRSDRLCVLALENVTYNTGLSGATGGQFLDIFPPDLSLKTLREIIHKKTVSLFEISFVLGWLFGGGDLEKLSLVKQAAFHFGMAFQIADDLEDVEQDAKNGRKVNLAGVFGVEDAEKMFHEEIGLFLKTLQQINLYCPELLALAELLVAKVEEEKERKRKRL